MKTAMTDVPDGIHSPEQLREAMTITELVRAIPAPGPRSAFTDILTWLANEHTPAVQREYLEMPAFLERV